MNKDDVKKMIQDKMKKDAEDEKVEGMTFNDGEREFASSNKVNKTYEQMLAELEGLDLSEGAEKIHIQRIGTPPKFSHKERLM
eukprot:939533-Prorocentrum_minimum.AAC.1